MNELRMEKEVYSEADWLDDLFQSAESERTVVVAKTSVKTFDLFCQSQGFEREQMLQRYQNWFKTVDGERDILR